MNAAPILSHGQFVYTRMKAFSWAANETFYPTMLQACGVRALVKVYRELETEKPLVINCQGMTEIESGAADSLATAYNETARPVIFLNANELSMELEQAFGPASAMYPNVQVCAYSKTPPGPAEGGRIPSQATELESAYIKKRVAKAFRKFEDGRRRLSEVDPKNWTSADER